ncbi:MAG: NAD(P)/FAD-dependent oxidoreductase [Christensenellales bacterium]
MMYDLIIVGGGAAGCSAALTARQCSMSVLLLFAGDGAMEKAHRMDNYPGMPQVEGREMVRVFRKQADDAGAVLKKRLVTRVLPLGGSFSVLAGNDLFEGKSILLAMGTSRVNPLPGEEELLGQGVSYCATCDGMFYRGKRIIVVAGGSEAVEEANYLAELGQVRYFLEKPHDTAGLSASVEIAAGKPREIRRSGDGLTLLTDQGQHETEGLFVLRPAVAMTQLLPEVAVSGASLTVDKDLMTSLPGVFAAGDILGAPLQAAKAVGEGNRAALSAATYLRQRAVLAGGSKA